MAASNDKIEKIYIVRADGTLAIIKDLREINQLFLDIAKSKAQLNAQQDGITNSAELTLMKEQMAELVAQETQLIERRQAAMESARQEIAANAQLIGSYDALTAAISGAAAGEGATGAAPGVSSPAAAVDAVAEAQERLTEATEGSAAAQQAANSTTTEAISEEQRLSQILVQAQADRMRVSAALRENSRAYNDGLITQEQFIATGGRLTQEQATLNRTIADTRRELTQQIVASQSAETSMQQLGTVLGILRAQYRQLTQAQRESAEGMELQTNIQTMDAEIKRLDGTIGNFQRNVGNYKSAFDGLGFSFQQILREAPSAAVSLNTFFLAISNNLPQFFDEVRRATEGQQDLKKAAEEATATMAFKNTVQQAAATAAENAEQALSEQVEGIIQSIGASREQAAAIREEITATVASGSASLEAAEAAGIHTEQIALNAGASVEDAAALRIQAQATAAAAVASTEATVALEAQAVATTAATAAAKGASLISRLGSAIFSVNTALTLGVLALTFYGKDIIDFIKGMDAASEAAKRRKESQEELDKAVTASVKSAEENAGKELATARVLYNAATNANLGRKAQLEAVDKLQAQYPGYFGNLTKEAILVGDAASAYKELTTAILARVAVEARQDQLKTLAVQQAKLEDLRKASDEQEKKDQETLKRLQLRGAFTNGNSASILTTQQKQLKAAGLLITNTAKDIYENEKAQATIRRDERNKELDQELADNQRQQEELADLIASGQEKISKLLLKPNPKAAPEAKNFARQEYQGQKELNDAIAALRDQQIEQDVQANRELFENETSTLEARLLAYENYASDRIYQAKAVRDNAIANAKAEAVAVDKLLSDGKAKSAEQSNSLLAQKKAANIKLQTAEEAYQASIAGIQRDTAKDVKSIVESDIKIRLDGINAIKETASIHASEQNEALVQARRSGLISEKEFRQAQKLLADEEHIYELQLIRDYLIKQVEAYTASGRDVTALQAALSKTNIELSAATDKLASDQQKRVFDLQKFYKDLRDTAINAARDIANGFIANQQRQIDKDIQLRQTALETEKQKNLAAAQSEEERKAIEKQADQDQEALERQAFERRKKLSIAQLAIEFAVASIKAISAGFETGLLPGALAAELLVALEYAAKLAVIESQRFALGGDVPTNGGEFGGAPHSRGGTKFGFQGQMFEAEVNELAVINKKSARSSDRLTVSGTPKQIASAINAYGGGVQFAPGAQLGRFDYGGSLGSSLAAPNFTPYVGAGADDVTLSFIRTATASIGNLNQRIDTLSVVLNPNHVERANDDHQKSVKLARL